MKDSKVYFIAENIWFGIVLILGLLNHFVFQNTDLQHIVWIGVGLQLNNLLLYIIKLKDE